MKLKYINEVADRHGGQPFFYFRHRGKRIRLNGAPGSTEFMAHYEELLETTRTPELPANVVPLRAPMRVEVKPAQPASVAFIPGSIAWTIDRYLTAKSSPFQKLAAGSQDNYRRFLKVIRDRIGVYMMSEITRAAVAKFKQDIAEERGTARGVLAVRLISLLWQFAKDLPEAKIADNAHNPTRDIALDTEPSKPALAWPDEVQRRFLDGASDRLRLAFYLLLYTGQRRSDVIKMKWADYDQATGFINVVQQKTGATVPVCVHRQLAAVLAAIPRAGDFILMSSHGKPYRDSSLTHAFEYRLRDAGIDAGTYTLHGLRKTAGVKLAEAGATELEIMRMLGHTKADQAHAYCTEANKRKLTRAAVTKWEKAG